MWTPENRGRYDRSALRYPSDVTNSEWALIGPLIPRAKPGGNKRTVDVREVVNGLLYVLSTGCQWAALPRDLPPRSTVNDYFRRWTDDGTLDRLHHALYTECRDLAEREASPSAAIIDSQSVKSAEKGGISIDPHGYDAGKKIKGKKRHVLVDTQGLLLPRLRGFARSEGVHSLFINELDEKVFTTLGDAGNGGGGDFGRWLIRQLELELPDQKLGFRLGLGVAGQQQLAPIGRRQMDIDHLHGGELLQGATHGQPRRQGMQSAL